MTEKNRLTALRILGAVAIAALVGGTVLLALDVPAEAAALVLSIGSAAAGAVGGALTFQSTPEPTQELS